MGTQIFLNGKTFQTQSAHLSDLLSFVRTAALKNGEVITDVRVDGESIAVQRDTDFAEFVLSDLERVEIQTRDVRKVTIEGLSQAHKSRLLLREKIEDVARHSRLCTLEENWQLLSDLIQQVEFVIMMFSSYNSFFSLQGNTILHQIEKINKVLQLLLRHMEKKRFVELADTLDYELLPQLMELIENIPVMLQNGLNTSH